MLELGGLRHELGRPTRSDLQGFARRRFIADDGDGSVGDFVRGKIGNLINQGAQPRVLGAPPDLSINGSRADRCDPDVARLEEPRQ